MLNKYYFISKAKLFKVFWFHLDFYTFQKKCTDELFTITPGTCNKKIYKHPPGGSLRFKTLLGFIT